MGAVLIEAPAREPVSLAEARAQLGLAHGDDDALVSTLISAARRVVEARTGLVLMHQHWLCLFDDWPDGGAMALPVAPVAEVEELAVFGEDEAKAVIDPAHYVADLASRPARLMLRGSRAWPRPARVANGIGVKVLAGFGPDPSDVPEPLRQAVLLLVAHFYAQRGSEAGSGLPLGLAPLLDPYRAVRL